MDNNNNNHNNNNSNHNDNNNDDNRRRGISFIGSIALLVSAMTGPGLVTIPLLFQISGWLLPTIMFIIAMSLGAISSLLLCEALTTIQGNEKFRRKIEFAHLINLLVPQQKVRVMIQFMLYLSIESVIIASIILSSQALDLMLLKWAGKTCGLGLHPNLGFFCIDDAINGNSPFGSDYMLASFGFLMTLGFCAPLSFLDLVDNVIVQIVSFGTLIFIVITWLVTFILTGLHKDYVPLVSDNQSQIVGTVLFNYAFVTTVPSWVNDLKPDVPIRKATWYSVIISTITYISLGILGGMTYKMDLASNIIAEIDKSSHKNFITDIATFLFPIAVLLTSIPVYSIIVRYNLERSGLFKRRMATVLSTLLPWVIVTPFQSGSWLNIFTNWTSLLFTSTSNFIIPFYLYYLSQKNNKTISIEIYEQKEKDLESLSIKITPSPSITAVPPSSPISFNENINNNIYDTKQSLVSSGDIKNIIEKTSTNNNNNNNNNSNNNDNNNNVNNNLLHPNQTSSLYYRNNRSNDNIDATTITTALLSSKNGDDNNNNPFIAFPVNGKGRMMVAMIAGIISLILVSGVIIYDFVKLALGSNVFDLSSNND